MGGIKNLEAKKKAAHICSSGGGGGGTKGPAVIDKRGQEQKCPYCDKVYTQSGRLKEHIASKHADQAGTSASASGSGAGSAAAPAPAPAHAGKGSQASSSAALSSSAAAASGSKPVLFEPGSKGGYYDKKSPKMHLHEWCQREGRPKPHYSTRTNDDGTIGCKVVLPDPKKRENDIVVFLDGEFSAADAEEAAQRGAVAALSRVAGERQFHLLLPKEFVPMWQRCGQMASERAAAAAARAEREAERRERERAAAARAAARAPQVVVMSDSKQKLVASLLQERAVSAAASAVGAPGGMQRSASAARSLGADSAGGSRGQQESEGGWVDEAESDSSSEEEELIDEEARRVHGEVVERLRGMGFSLQQVSRVAEATGGAGGMLVDVTTALDWLVLNLGQEELPVKFRAASATNSVTVLSRAAAAAAGQPAASGKGAAATQLAKEEEDDQAPAAVAALMRYGYSRSEAGSVLEACGGSHHAALCRLFASLHDGNAELLATVAAAPSSSASADWDEEVMVLQSIYGDDAHAAQEPHHQLTVRLPVPDGLLAQALAHGGGGKAAAAAPSSEAAASVCIAFTRLAAPGGAGQMYPSLPPLVTIESAVLPRPALRCLTQRLAQQASGLLGSQMLYELCSAASQAMEEGLGALMVAAAAAAVSGSKAVEDEEPSAGVPTSLGSSSHLDQLAAKLKGSSLEDGAAGGSDGRVAALGSKGRPPRSAKGRQDDRSGAPRRTALDPAKAAEESRRLQEYQRELDTADKHAAMRAARQKLPAYALRAELLAQLAASSVLVISGATGCGKSTQVPQYILEAAAQGGWGAAANIICTQPRRISALGLAHRVSNERAESVGESVGYSVRLDSKVTWRTRLTFCTTGILLRRMLSEPRLEGVSHIILDEVHERSVEIDLLLMLLRDLVAKRNAASNASASGGGPPLPPLKLVLMSATADAQSFASYMLSRVKSGVGCLTIPGFTHPVREFYLEDILEDTGYIVGRKSKYAKKVKTGGGGGGKDGNSGNGGGGDDEDGGEPSEVELASVQKAVAAAQRQYSVQTLRSLSVVNESVINYELLERLVTRVVRLQLEGGGPGALLAGWGELDAKGRAALKHGGGSGGKGSGAILVFLPGSAEISKLMRKLFESDALTALTESHGHKLRVLPLHGSLSASDQMRVFAPSQHGVTKIVLATNVAETSITIDDVTCVIDSGKAKEMIHDAERGIQRLEEGWVSQAAAQQRRGRAGRVQPGACFRLFSRRQWASMPAQQLPEMLRSPLESVCLLVKGMMQKALAAAAVGDAAAGATATAAKQLPSVSQVLGNCLSPPTPAAVNAAVTLLRAIQAFDGSEQLTPLGQHLTRMPMDPRLGKALVYAAMLGCLDSALTVAAALAYGRPVFTPLFSGPGGGADEDVARRRAELLTGAVAARSDHVALVSAYAAWQQAAAKGDRHAAKAFCHGAGLSEQAMEAVQASRREFAATLADLGFLPRAAVSGGAVNAPPGSAAAATWLQQPANRNTSNHRFLKAALCAGFYPSLLRVQHPPKVYKQVEGGALEVEPEPRAVKFFDRTRGRAFVHPASVLFNVGRYQSGWVAYTQMSETSKLYVREASMVPVFSLLLFGGALRVEHEQGLLVVDDWMEFKAPASMGVLVRQLRAELDRELLLKIADPDFDLAGSKVVAAMMELLSSDGF